MKTETVTGFKDTLTGSIPIVEDIEVKHSKDISKTKAQCTICKCNGAKYVSTVSGMVLMCRDCEKKMTVTLYIADIQLKTDVLVVDLIGWLNWHPLRAFRLSTQSTALKNPLTRALMVNIKDKYNMKLTTNAGKVTPYPQ